MKALLAVLLIVLIAPAAYAQREASFVQPGTTAGGQKRDSDEVIAATPRDMQIGDTIVGITKRVRLYFTNYGGKEAAISDVSLSADSNVRTEITADDCTKVSKLKPNDKCSISIEITPNSPGKWAGELVMVHDAPGRVSRASLSGTTAGDIGAGGQQPGLSLVGASKDQVIDFGNIVSGGNAVRSVLLANDSPNPLHIEKLELINADNGLALLKEGGCVEGMEIAPGGSCPVTAIWQPSSGREISTDLIIRHTGPMGYAVIPVRGKSEGGSAMAGTGSSSSMGMPAPVVAEAEPMPSMPAVRGGGGGGRIPAIAASDLYGSSGMPSPAMGTSLVLRGTSGTRAILADAEGKVIVADVDDVIESDGGKIRILNVEPSRVTIDSNGTQINLKLKKPVSGSPKTATDEPAGGGATQGSRGGGQDS